MADNPKISKHHSGQHPTLKSFQAFDIIPANKVKPSHTARPVISNPVKHFDTTLTPAKAESAKPAPTETPVLMSTEAAPEPTPTEAVAETKVPDEPTPETPVPLEPTTQTEAQTPDSPPVPEPLPEQKPPQEPEPAPTEPTPPAETNGLSDIIDQTSTTSDKSPAEDKSSVKHSEEFKSVLQEFTANQPEKNEAKPIVAVHKHSYLRMLGMGFLWLIAAVALAALVLNVLLDTGLMQDFYGLPHTTFFNK